MQGLKNEEKKKRGIEMFWTSIKNDDEITEKEIFETRMEDERIGGDPGWNKNNT